MSSYRRAVSHADMDRLSRSRLGMLNAAQEVGLKQLYLRLGEGWPSRDIDRMWARYYPAIPAWGRETMEAYVRAASSARERQERFANCVLGRIDPMTYLPVAPLPPSVHEQVRGECEALAVQDFAMPLTERLEKTDQHRDRQNGIDERARAEAAKKAALMNDDVQRHNAVERAWDKHEGPRRDFLAREKLEVIAQGLDRNNERIRDEIVLYSDRTRDPMRSDDRRAALDRIWDGKVLVDAAADAMAVVADPYLESVHDSLVHAESMSE